MWVVGATKLSQLCKELEFLGRAGNTADAKLLLPQVMAEYKRVEAALLETLKSTTS